MFPIRDRRGRVISFGGRMLGDGQPKYVNGPETALFSKRRTLYALDLAREAARAAQPIVVVEGYMDVIALHQAGFTRRRRPARHGADRGATGRAVAAAAPAHRCASTATPPAAAPPPAPPSLALPHAHRRTQPETRLAAGRRGSGQPGPPPWPRRPCRRCWTPPGRSRRRCSSCVRGTAGGDATPEARAAVVPRGSKRPPAASATARSPGNTAGPSATASVREPAGAPAAPPPPNTRSFPRPRITLQATHAEQARTLLAILLSHPSLLGDVEEAFGGIDLPPPLARLRAAMLEWAERAELLDSAALFTHLQAVGLAADAAQALSALPNPLPACAAPDAMPAEAKEGWWHFFGADAPRPPRRGSGARRCASSRTIRTTRLRSGG